MKAMLLRGEIAYEAFAYADAANTFQEVIEFGERINDAGWLARGSYCRGACELELGNLGDAGTLFQTALVIFRESGPASERISTEWGMARVVLHGGKPREAVQQLRDVIAEFDAIGMESDAALARVDMSEALLVLELWEEIVKVAGHAFRVLKKAGILTGALTAFAYVKEAAAKRQLTPEALKAVREYLRRVDREPDLLFMPPPEPPR